MGFNLEMMSIARALRARECQQWSKQYPQAFFTMWSALKSCCRHVIQVTD